MNRQTFTLLEGYMLECMQDAAHDREHVYRVLNNAVTIAQGEADVQWDVLVAAALLHDISRPEQIADSRIDHATHGAEKAYIFLMNHGFDEGFSSHGFRKSAPPATLEARILFDADKLDVCGAIGIARTLQYSGETGRPIYTRNALGEISDGSGDTLDSFFREYKFKLEGICEHFLTDKGRALARERHGAAMVYYQALLAEVRQNEGLTALINILDA